MRFVSFAFVIAVVTSFASIAAADAPSGPKCHCESAGAAQQGLLTGSLLGVGALSLIALRRKTK
jgi:hypothetical protein